MSCVNSLPENMVECKRRSQALFEALVAATDQSDLQKRIRKFEQAVVTELATSDQWQDELETRVDEVMTRDNFNASINVLKSTSSEPATRAKQRHDASDMYKNYEPLEAQFQLLQAENDDLHENNAA